MRKIHERYEIGIEQHKYSDEIWEVSEIPCIHFVEALAYKGEQFENYVHQDYRIESLATTWVLCVSY